jgi:glycosyltransferase involved in cell wall biosynthesis
LIPSRPKNGEIWIRQFIYQSKVISNVDADFTYSSLFPGIFRGFPANRSVIRLHDPLGNSTNSLKELLRSGTWKQRLARALRTSAFNRSVRNNALLVANSFFTRERFIEIYGLSKDSIQVIWPSVGFEYSRNSSQMTPDLDRRYILSIMGQRQRKRPIFAIEAWAECAQELELDFINVGFIPQNLLSSKARQLKDQGRLEIREGVDAKELSDLQSGAFASVFCSTGEGFGLPIAESLFAGVPIIHNDLPVFRELTDGVTPTFDFSSTSTLSMIFKRLLKDEDFYLGMRNACWHKGGRFTHEHSGKAWKEIMST